MHSVEMTIHISISSSASESLFIIKFWQIYTEYKFAIKTPSQLPPPQDVNKENCK